MAKGAQYIVDFVARTGKFKAGMAGVSSTMQRVKRQGDGAFTGYSAGALRASMRTSGLNTQMRKLSVTMRKAKTVGNRMITALAGVGTLIVLIRTAAYAVVGFEKAMGRVLSITNANTKAFGMMRAEAQRLGATTIYTAKEAAEGLQFLVMAGMSATKATRNLRHALNLAQAGGMDLGRAADIVTNIMTAFRMESQQTEKAVDALAVVASSSNTNIQQLGDAMKYVSASANTYGLSIYEVAAGIGVLSDAGMQGSMAGTGLRQVFVRLANQTGAMKKGMAELGIEFRDVNPEMHSLVEILDRFSATTISATQISKMFGSRAANAFANLLAGRDKLVQLTAAQENASSRAQEMADKFGGTLYGQLKKVQSAYEDLFITMFNTGSVAEGFADKLALVANVLKFFSGKLDIFEEGADGMQDWGGAVDETYEKINNMASVVKGLIPHLKTLGILFISMKLGAFIGMIAKCSLSMRGMAAATKASIVSCFKWDAITKKGAITAKMHALAIRSVQRSHILLNASTKATTFALFKMRVGLIATKVGFMGAKVAGMAFRVVLNMVTVAVRILRVAMAGLNVLLGIWMIVEVVMMLVDAFSDAGDEAEAMTEKVTRLTDEVAHLKAGLAGEKMTIGVEVDDAGTWTEKPDTGESVKVGGREVKAFADLRTNQEYLDLLEHIDNQMENTINTAGRLEEAMREAVKADNAEAIVNLQKEEDKLKELTKALAAKKKWIIENGQAYMKQKIAVEALIAAKERLLEITKQLRTESDASKGTDIGKLEAEKNAIEELKKSISNLADAEERNVVHHARANIKRDKAELKEEKGKDDPDVDRIDYLQRNIGEKQRLIKDLEIGGKGDRGTVAEKKDIGAEDLEALEVANKRYKAANTELEKARAEGRDTAAPQAEYDASSDQLNTAMEGAGVGWMGRTGDGATHNEREDREIRNIEEIIVKQKLLNMMKESAIAQQKRITAIASGDTGEESRLDAVIEAIEKKKDALLRTDEIQRRQGEYESKGTRTLTSGFEFDTMKGEAGKNLLDEISHIRLTLGKELEQVSSLLNAKAGEIEKKLNKTFKPNLTEAKKALEGKVKDIGHVRAKRGSRSSGVAGAFERSAVAEGEYKANRDALHKSVVAQVQVSQEAGEVGDEQKGEMSSEEMVKTFDTYKQQFVRDLGQVKADMLRQTLVGAQGSDITKRRSTTAGISNWTTDIRSGMKDAQNLLNSDLEEFFKKGDEHVDESVELAEWAKEFSQEGDATKSFRTFAQDKGASGFQLSEIAKNVSRAKEGKAGRAGDFVEHGFLLAEGLDDEGSVAREQLGAGTDEKAALDKAQKFVDDANAQIKRFSKMPEEERERSLKAFEDLKEMAGEEVLGVKVEGRQDEHGKDLWREKGGGETLGEVTKEDLKEADPTTRLALVKQMMEAVQAEIMRAQEEEKELAHHQAEIENMEKAIAKAKAATYVAELKSVQQAEAKLLLNQQLEESLMRQSKLVAMMAAKESGEEVVVGKKVGDVGRDEKEQASFQRLEARKGRAERMEVDKGEDEEELDSLAGKFNEAMAAVSKQKRKVAKAKEKYENRVGSNEILKDMGQFEPEDAKKEVEYKRDLDFQKRQLSSKQGDEDVAHRAWEAKKDEMAENERVQKEMTLTPEQEARRVELEEKGAPRKGEVDDVRVPTAKDILALEKEIKNEKTAQTAAAKALAREHEKARDAMIKQAEAAEIAKLSLAEQEKKLDELKKKGDEAGKEKGAAAGKQTKDELEMKERDKVAKKEATDRFKRTGMREATTALATGKVTERRKKTDEEVTEEAKANLARQGMWGMEGTKKLKAEEEKIRAKGDPIDVTRNITQVEREALEERVKKEAPREADRKKKEVMAMAKDAESKKTSGEAGVSALAAIGGGGGVGLGPIDKQLQVQQEANVILRQMLNVLQAPKDLAVLGMGKQAAMQEMQAKLTQDEKAQMTAGFKALTDAAKGANPQELAALKEQAQILMDGFGEIAAKRGFNPLANKGGGVVRGGALAGGAQMNKFEQGMMARKARHQAGMNERKGKLMVGTNRWSQIANRWGRGNQGRGGMPNNPMANIGNVVREANRMNQGGRGTVGGGVNARIAEEQKKHLASMDANLRKIIKGDNVKVIWHG